MISSTNNTHPQRENARHLLSVFWDFEMAVKSLTVQIRTAMHANIEIWLREIELRDQRRHTKRKHAARARCGFKVRQK